jgi:SpoVK/Ycf46/Vps4 family AAA+-type ATPase
MEAVIEPWAHQIGWYMRNCLAARKTDRLFKVVETHAESLATSMHESTQEDVADSEEEQDEDPSGQDAGSSRARLSLDGRKRLLSEFLSAFSEPPPQDDVVEENVGFASDEFGLSPLDAGILLLVVRYINSRRLEDFCDDVLEAGSGAAAAVAALLDADVEEVEQRLTHGAPLVANGILYVNRGGTGLSKKEGILVLTPAIFKTMRRPYDNREAWASVILGRPMEATTTWQDHAHLGAEAELALRALRGWRENPIVGLNVMLVGPPGTGKTEFAKVLSAACGLKPWAVGESDDDDKEPSRSERLGNLSLAFAVLRSKRDSALIFDEAEDVLQAGHAFGSRRGEHSKSYTNRLLENNPVPVIWTCNELGEMDPASVRRMSIIIKMKVPDQATRCRIWERVFEECGAVGEDGAAGRLSARWMAPPAVAANAARVARLAGGGEAEIETALKGVMAALGAGSGPSERGGGDFDPELVLTSEDLSVLAERLSRPQASRNWSACFYGEPGTGKSEYARYLAARLGMKVTHKKPSELGSKYVNEAEKVIAAAFAEARAEGTFLIIDEFDSLMLDRGTAERSWEVSTVNEMLIAMEHHPLPFVATTNLMARMDKAAFRRFTFKLKFSPLDERRARVAFRRILGVQMPDGSELPAGLTPGDFAAVRKRARLFGDTDPLTLLRWVSEEAETKQGGPPREIGFATRRPTPVQTQAVGQA